MPLPETDAAKPAPAAKCERCDRLSSGDIWGVQLCFDHLGQWHHDCPGAFELASEADVERRPRAFGGPDLVRLKPGAEARLLEAWTREWAKRAAA